jgi:hypothetical protein
MPCWTGSKPWRSGDSLFARLRTLARSALELLRTVSEGVTSGLFAAHEPTRNGTGGFIVSERDFAGEVRSRQQAMAQRARASPKPKIDVGWANNDGAYEALRIPEVVVHLRRANVRLLDRKLRRFRSVTKADVGVGQLRLPDRRDCTETFQFSPRMWRVLPFPGGVNLDR